MISGCNDFTPSNELIQEEGRGEGRRERGEEREEEEKGIYHGLTTVEWPQAW